MRNIQECKDEIRRRGEARIVQIARTRRRIKVISGALAMCCFVAVLLPVALSMTSVQPPLVPVEDLTPTTSFSTTHTTVSHTEVTFSTTCTPVQTTSSVTGSVQSQTTDSTRQTTQSTAASTTVGVVPTTPTTTSVTAPTTTHTTAPTTIPTTASTTSPTTSSTTSPTTDLTTTTTTGGGLFPPLGDIVNFLPFTVGNATGAVGDLLTIPISVEDEHYLVNAELYLTYDPSVLQPVIMNDADGDNPFVTDLNPVIFPNGQAFSDVSSDGTLNIRITQPENMNVTEGGTMCYVTFRAVAPTTYTQITLDANIQASPPEHITIIFTTVSGQITITAPSTTDTHP